MTHSLRFLSLASLLGAFTIGVGHAQDSGPNAAAASGVAAMPAAAVAAAPAFTRTDSVYVNPEVRPRFVGGDKAFLEYLNKSIRYPPLALQRHVSGRVYVAFILSAQGRVQDAHVISGPGNGLNDEALRLVWLMPPWEPARVKGQPVRVACTMPIAFNADH